MHFSVGVVGATGFIGTPYRSEIRDSQEDATIIALCARRRDLLETAGQQDGAKLLTNDWREIVNHPDVNLVVVATPDALHYETVLACAEQGKHVFCEKPVGMTVQQAYKMWRACCEAKVAHYVPYWTRYVPIFERAREIVREGQLGDVKAVVYRWHNPRPAAMPFTWRDDATLSSAGSIADVGSHAYDAMRWVLGEDAVRVVAHADVITPSKPDLGAINLEEAIEWGQAHGASESANVRKGTAFDYANIAIEFESGMVGVLILSHAPYLRKGLAPEFELHGTEASLSIDRISGTVTICRGSDQPQVLAEVADPGFGNRFAQYVFPALRAGAVGENEDHPNLNDGWRVQLFTDAAAMSAQRGAAVELAELNPDKRVDNQ